MMNRMLSQFREPMRMMENVVTPLLPIRNCDIIETDTSFVVQMDLPGVKPEDLCVEVTEKNLMIRGTQKHTKESSSDTFIRKERTEGEVSRTIAIPENANSHEAHTSLCNGVLSVTFPKTQSSIGRTRKLNIQASDDISERGESKQARTEGSNGRGSKGGRSN